MRAVRHLYFRNEPKSETMLTLPFLQKILRGELEQCDVDKQVIESPGGYDGIVSLVQTKGLQKAVVLEHNTLGELSIRPGGFMIATQSIWIMKMIGKDADRAAAQAEMFADMKRIVGVLAKYHQYPESLLGWDAEVVRQYLDGWDPYSMPYSVRNAGPNYTGYEFSLNFDEDIDLAYHALPKK